MQMKPRNLMVIETKLSGDVHTLGTRQGKDGINIPLEISIFTDNFDKHGEKHRLSEVLHQENEVAVSASYAPDTNMVS